LLLIQLLWHILDAEPEICTDNFQVEQMVKKDMVEEMNF
jgi:hypothetical protein